MTTKIMDCDLAVLGAGGAGLVAAVKACEDGVKKVIVLEKAKKPGGATYFAGGPGVQSLAGGMPGNQSGRQSSQGDQGGQSGMAGAAGGMGGGQSGMQGDQGGGSISGGSPSVTSQFSNWFTSKVGSENFVKAARTPKYIDLPDPSIGPGRGGSFTVDKMVEFCQKQGIQILYETPARKFITDVKGKVTGVLADTTDGQLLVNCKACIIASGGFGRNYEKLQKYWPEEYNNKEIFFLCPPGMMGDGIDMAEAIGAYIDQTKWKQSDGGGFFASGPIHHPYSWTVQSLMMGGIFINLEGKQWKQQGFGEGGSGGNSLASQPGGVVYSVCDSDMVEATGKQLGSGGGMMAQTMSDPNSNEARAIKKWREDLEYEAAIDDEGASGNHVKKANSLVELALKMKIDPATFVKTIEEYNKAVESGEDDDFDSMPQMGGQGSGGMGSMSSGMGGQSGQDSQGGMQGGQSGMGGGPGGMQGQSRKQIKTPPFYAIFGHRYSQCTKGLYGIAVSSDFEVLNPKGEAMPGLYAAGDTCTIYGGLILGPGERGNSSSVSTVPAGSDILSTTPSPCQGSNAAFMSGYSAGVHVAEFLKKI